MPFLARLQWKIMLFALLFMLSSAGASDQDIAYTVIQRSVTANSEDWKAAPAFDYSERDQVDGQTNTYEETMILGSPYERLVAVNGRALPPAQQAEQQRKLDEVTADRRNESPQQRKRRIAKYEKDRKHDHSLMDQLVQAFNFELVGQQTLGGYDVYVLKATPRTGYAPPNMESQALTGMEGKLWVDKKTFQWVKVEAEVIHPVSIGGFLARVEPGTRFELEKMPVTDSVWLPKHFAMTAHAKILSLFSHNSHEDDTYFDYHKARAQADLQTGKN